MTVNEITSAKVEFKLDLVAAGLNVLEYVPERVVPPIVIVNSRSPYLQPADLGAEFTLGLELVLVAATATNKQATEKLDELICDAVNALPGYARLITVGQPFNMQTNNAEYLAVSMLVDLNITI